MISKCKKRGKHRNSLDKKKSMSEMSEIDQVHLRAVMLFMSETSEIIIIFNIQSV